MGRGPFPLVARAGFTLWMAAWVPVILFTHGVQNFWWLCNIAQFIVLYAVWRPSVLLVSSQAGTAVLVGVVWMLDIAVALALGGSVTGITDYMFDPGIPLIARLSSTYHVWLPVFLVWLCWYNGYDRRGVWLQCVIGTLAILGAWLVSEPVRNVNYAFAPIGIEQTWMPHGVYVVLLTVATALLIYWPGHCLVRFILGRLPARGGAH